MSRIKYDYDFMAGMHLSEGLLFNRYRLDIEFITASESAIEHNIAFERINFLLQDVVQRSIFVAKSETDVIRKYSEAGIPVLTVPDPGPYDQVVQAVIINKINNIMESALVVGESTLSSIIGGFVTYIFDPDDEDEDINNLVNSEDDDEWYATTEPRFISIGAANRMAVDENTYSWEDLDLGWESEVTVEFVPDFNNDEEEEEQDTIGDSTVIKISDFNKK